MGLGREASMWILIESLGSFLAFGLSGLFREPAG